MNTRITCISVLSDEDKNKIEKILPNSNDFCKVPYGIDNRIENDTLPYHFTLSVWDKQYEQEIIKQFSNIEFPSIKVLLQDIIIKPSYNNSYNLCFKLKSNQELLKLQQFIYSKLPSEKYNPDVFIPHITITVDTDYELLKSIKNDINNIPNSIEINISKLSFYKIYPAIKLL